MPLTMDRKMARNAGQECSTRAKLALLRSSSASRVYPQNLAAGVEKKPSNVEDPTSAPRQSQLESSQKGVVQADSVVNEPHLADFLRDILQDLPPSELQGPLGQSHGTFTPFNVLDFSQQMYPDLPDIDFSYTQDWNVLLNPETVNEGLTSTGTSSLDDSLGLGNAAFSRSTWRWTPNHEKGGDVPGDTALSPEDEVQRRRLDNGKRCLPQCLDSRSRDRIVGMLLSACDHINYDKIVTLLPPTPVLDAMINDFLSWSESSIDHWIHTHSLSLPDCRPELLGLMIAGGAIRSPLPEVHKFGYALQEICRLAVHLMFEKDNSTSRELEALQAFAICLDIGVWSGERRIMELAESTFQPLVTTLRRSERFRRSPDHLVPPQYVDSDATLDIKWRAWVSAESWKRLAYHVLIHNGHTSIAFQTPPLVSYSEVTIDLPAPKCLWRARSAREWRDQYHATGTAQKLPSLVQCIWSAEQVALARHHVDIDLTMYVILLSHWSLVWEFRQIDSTLKAQGGIEPSWNAGLLASSKCHELRGLLDHFQAVVNDWSIDVPTETRIVAELVRMNLCVAFEDLQLLAGKDSEVEAKRVYPSLRQWYYKPDARTAMWHAGQILYAAKPDCIGTARSPRASRALADFHAVAIYHAGLAFWVYGLLARTSAQDSQLARPPGIAAHGDPVILNRMSTSSSTDRHRFVALDHGIPTLQRDLGDEDNRSSSTQVESEASICLHDHTPAQALVALSDSANIMDLVIDVMRDRTSLVENTQATGGTGLPVIVRNLIQLLRDLGVAASTL
ncbi:hypothetical protein LTR36_001160 [Oleoguttula mirabilis]|uniref:Xylanolytic transcriptional activator regulatory domain-containing protein n=1 Tax=Oleoguttula mirabilis TaxID=1507867 RepID=A0AAV9J2W8_9PEZI|nr:hypothetical protein LTR36_001160 [Oleoguttula mirabilis]